jgi:ergothioneine biosynthesis protein EgtB
MNAPDRLPTLSAAGRRRGLLEDYRQVRAATVALAAPLAPEDCQAQSMPDASPVKWHLAHTTWFFETFLLGDFVDSYRPANPEYRVLFNSYYNAVGEKHPRPQRGLLTRPSLQEVMDYRARVDEAMAAAIVDGATRDIEAFDSLLVLGLNHEQQHQELILTDVKHLLSCNPLGPAYLVEAREADEADEADVAPSAVSDSSAATGVDDAAQTAASFIGFDGGIVEIGHDGGGFCFDNELPAHQVLLQPFELADRLVTCAEYLAFVRDGGYRRSEFWLSLGWDRVQAEGWDMPFYWRAAQASADSNPEGLIEVFGLSGWRPLNPAEPVAHLSYFEADAYARWANCRLPTEAEWEHAAGRMSIGDEANLLERGGLRPRPAAPRRPGEHRSLQQMWGDLWEWTASAYLPYHGFKTSAGAVGEYNGKFMANQFVLRGGSFATSRSHIRKSYRNFFPPEARWQFSGLRLARDVPN